MVVRTLGVGTLTRLMAVEDDGAPDLSWLLSGPTDSGVVVSGADDIPPLAAE